MSNRFLRWSAAIHVAVPIGALILPAYRWPLLGVLIADHLAVIGAGLVPRSTLLGPNLRCLDARALDGDGVVLTLDDGPDPTTTPEVLRILEEHDARASFFCIGERVERWPDLAREIVARGHGVENHTFGHPSCFYFLSPKAMAKQIDRTQRAIEEATLRPSGYFRAPAGFRNLFLEKVLCERGLQLVSWSRRGFDTVRRDADGIVERLTDRLRPGEILLLHDRVVKHRSGSRGPLIVEALPRLLAQIRAVGLRATGLPVDATRVDRRIDAARP